MGQEGVSRALAIRDEIDIRVILEEQRKAEARIAEAKKLAEEIISRAREQAKSILASAQDVTLDDNIKSLLEEEQLKVRESLEAFERQEREKLELLKTALSKNEHEIWKALLEALIG